MISVLVFYRDSEWFGGVVNFVDSLKKTFSDDIKFNQFKIGQRKGFSSRWLRPLLPFLDALRLIILLFTHRYDAYHVNPSLNTSSLLRDGLFIFVLRIMRAKNVIVVFHGWSDKLASDILRSRVRRLLFKWVFGYAYHTLVLAQDFRRWFIGMGFPESRVHLFTTMFDSAEFSNVRTIAARNASRILLLSRLVREKGVYELTNAFRDLAAERPELVLVFAGTGPEEAELKQYVSTVGIKDRVEFLGYVRGQDKVKVFAEAGMFLLPTYYGEGCPVSLLEAMAAGLPVITTPVGGIPHIVKDGINGFVLATVSVESVREAVRTLLDDPALGERMGDINADQAWAKYSAPVVTAMFERLYSGKGA